MFNHELDEFPASLCGTSRDHHDIYKDVAKRQDLRNTNTALTYELLAKPVAQGRSVKHSAVCTGREGKREREGGERKRERERGGREKERERSNIICVGLWHTQ